MDNIIISLPNSFVEFPIIYVTTFFFNFQVESFYTDFISREHGESNQFNAMLVFQTFHGWQLAKMKKSIPDMSLP